MASFLTPAQKADALVLFSVTPNERRVRVLTAYLGIAVGDLYEKMGLKTGTLNSYHHDAERWAYWQREGAIKVAFQIATFLGLALTELFEIDDEFEPWKCVPVFMNENSERMSRTRKGKSGWRGKLAVVASLLLIVAASASAQTLTLGWDPNTEPDLTGYVVQSATKAGGPYSDRMTTAATSAVIDQLAPGAQYFFVVRAVNSLGLLSLLSNEIAFTAPGLPADDCAPVTGRYAISIFYTSLLKTGSGGPGSRARILFQLGSPNAPITTVTVNADGAAVAPTMRGEYLNDVPGSWFTMPGSGTHQLTVTATNSQNCSRTVPYAVPLTVP